MHRVAATTLRPRPTTMRTDNGTSPWITAHAFQYQTAALNNATCTSTSTAAAPLCSVAISQHQMSPLLSISSWLTEHPSLTQSQQPTRQTSPLPLTSLPLSSHGTPQQATNSLKATSSSAAPEQSLSLKTVTLSLTTSTPTTAHWHTTSSSALTK